MYPSQTTEVGYDLEQGWEMVGLQLRGNASMRVCYQAAKFDSWLRFVVLC